MAFNGNTSLLLSADETIREPFWDEEELRELEQVVSQRGYVCAEVPVNDLEGDYLAALACKWGRPVDHGATSSILWDVCPKAMDPDCARSNTAEEFPLHTDCAFELLPPRYVGLQVIREDKCGGGESILVDAQAALQRLSHAARTALSTLPVTWRVPREFYKGQHTIQAPILGLDGALRFRRDIIVDELLSDRQRKALEEFEVEIRATPALLKSVLPRGSLLIIDNWRMLHARSEVHDMRRLLKRVRFHPRQHVAFT